MAVLKLLSLASASALLMADAVHQSEKQAPLTARAQSSTYTVNLGGTAVCLAEINEAREAAGLAHFKVATEEEHMLPKAKTEEQHNTAWNPVCEALIKEDEEQAEKSTSANGFKSGTYAYMALQSATPDCAAAVSHWKDAVNNFTTIPPAKDEHTKLYEKQQNISFVAMYNPSNDAAADCRVVTCTQTAAPDPPTDELRNAGEGKTGYALLCMTTPEALKADAAPFDEEQWKKIKASITGSASAVAPSLLAVGIAAVGLLAL
ncbi:SAG family member [Eimeria mitis]|uniref:SAG family member n=1 Tax=Eimeria mitis TaxID=44415 RepID=U6K9T6_9EIME|nr:SAG family member [Eimeria mitis]CDJ34724.1 SAG family member [Eimeria mitis]